MNPLPQLSLWGHPIVQKICPIGNEINKIIKEKEYLGNILKDGAEKAKAIAQPVLEETKKIIGIA